MVTSVLTRDFMGRDLITDGETGDKIDFLGRGIGAGGVGAADETDYLGRLLLAPE